ncbi:phage exclusion protein Lit family protein [Parvularcula maris]|uniref:Phage exclusion protein Lit family protein n=1 Tax=Parvularcula maris TaxID=2965077 RepID=A0A9X2LAF3_9PROT|nr:phage exclusion protein Lit family protein [Parvularcula maris]MCQ8185951.1 phage exclusion protein Lit family protein [Parvularcula maris]
MLSTMHGVTLEQALNTDPERGPFELDFKQRISRAHSLIAADETSDISWPADIHEPTPDRESLDDPQHQATFDLVGLALAFAFLHEFRHVKYLADGDTPSTLPEEEIACDAYAREFMTSRVADYANKHGHRFIEVHQKRAAGIALAAIIIHAMTPTHAYWGNRQYPPIAERLTAMIGNYRLPADSSFWCFTACLLIALMRLENRSLDVVANSNEEIVNILLDRLR